MHDNLDLKLPPHARPGNKESERTEPGRTVADVYRELANGASSFNWELTMMLPDGRTLSPDVDEDRTLLVADLQKEFDTPNPITAIMITKER